MGEKIRVGLVLFPRLTQLDLTGPAEVFARMPGAEIHLLWKTLDPGIVRPRTQDPAHHDVRSLPWIRCDLRSGRPGPDRTHGG